ncbi:MAG: hypothetical protein WC891_02930 [Actinomycetota bacterium]
MSKLVIKGKSLTANGLTFELDGVPLKHLRELDLSMSTEDVNTVTLKILIDEIDFDAEALITLQALVEKKMKADEVVKVFGIKKP